jgi:hypothetical protein
MLPKMKQAEQSLTVKSVKKKPFPLPPLLYSQPQTAQRQLSTHQQGDRQPWISVKNPTTWESIHLVPSGEPDGLAQKTKATPWMIT